MIESEDELIPKIEEAIEISREINPELEEKLKKNQQFLENIKNSYSMSEKNSNNEKSLKKNLQTKIYPEKNISIIQKSIKSYISSQKQCKLIMNFGDLELSCPVTLHESYLSKTKKVEKAIICIDSTNFNLLIKNWHKCLNLYKNLKEEEFQKIEEQNTRSLKYSGEANLSIPINNHQQFKVSIRLYNSDSIARIHNLHQFSHLYSIFNYFKSKKSSISNKLKKDREILLTEKYDDFVNSYFVLNLKMKSCLNSKKELHSDSISCKETNLNFKELFNDNPATAPDKKS